MWVRWELCLSLEELILQFLYMGIVCASRKPRGWGSRSGLEVALGWGPPTQSTICKQKPRLEFCIGA